MRMNKTRHGGRRTGAGRKSSLTVNERLIAGNRCDEMLHAKAIERALVQLFGEQDARALDAALDVWRARDAALTASFRDLSPEEQQMQRVDYAARRDRLRGVYSRYFRRILHDNKIRKGAEKKPISLEELENADIIGGCIGVRRGRGPRLEGWDVEENTRADIISDVAAEMSEGLGRSVSTAAVRKAWEFTRALAAEKPAAEIVFGEAILSLSGSEET